MLIFEKINDKKLAGSNSILAGVPPINSQMVVKESVSIDM